MHEAVRFKGRTPSAFNNYHKIAIRITHVCQNFGVREVIEEIQKKHLSGVMCHLSGVMLPSGFPNNFS